MKDECGSYILGQVVDEVVKERGLACTDLTGQYDETFFLPPPFIGQKKVDQDGGNLSSISIFSYQRSWGILIFISFSRRHLGSRIRGF